MSDKLACDYCGTVKRRGEFWETGTAPNGRRLARFCTEECCKKAKWKKLSNGNQRIYNGYINGQQP